MGFSRSLATISVLGLLAGSAAAADLSRIPRTIAKEPVYKTKPKYCLVIFGPEANKRMWVVLDGAVLYVDKNGDGDLTAKGASLSFTKQPLPNTADPTYPLQEIRVFSVGNVKAGDLTFEKIEVCHTILKKTFQAETGSGKELSRLLKNNPGLTRLGVTTSRKGNVGIQAIAYAADSPKEAPILHIDGPLTMQPFQVFQVSELVRGAKASDFYAVLGTKGLGEDSFAIRDYSDIPESAMPLLQIEFPGKNQSKRPETKVSLGRC